MRRDLLPGCGPFFYGLFKYSGWQLIIIQGAKGIVRIFFLTEDNRKSLFATIDTLSSCCNLKEYQKRLIPAFTELQAYFDGDLKEFTLSIDLCGTPFQKKVWGELRKIPYGSTASYSEIATRIGNPKAQRAVGMANNRNPVPIIIPCHRVIGKNGDLTGFASGLEHKRNLLLLEERRALI